MVKSNFVNLQKTIFLFTLLLFCNLQFSFAQEKTSVKTASDSVIAIPDTLLFRIEQAQNAIKQINAQNKTGVALQQIKTQLPDIKDNIYEIKDDLNGSSRVIEIKTLLSYQTILSDQQDQLAAWRKTLSASNDAFRKMANQIINFSGDTLLSDSGKDSTQKKLYDAQLTDLRFKLQKAGKTTTASLDSVGSLLAQVSAVSFDVNNLQADINERLKTSGQSAFSKESPYLWSAPPITTTTNIGKLFRTSYQGQNRILSYFFNSTWDNRLLLILFAIGFFVWVFRNFKVVNKVPHNPKLATLKFNYIGSLPILSTLIVLLTLAPLFEPNSPPSYIEITQFALLIVLTLFFRPRIDAQKFKLWLLLVVFFAAVIVTVTVINYGLILRSWLIVLNLGSIYFAIRLYRTNDKKIISKKYIRPVTAISLILNSLAILFNFFGRISLAKVFSQTAIISLTQLIGLAVLVHILSEALELQIRISSCSEGLFSRINFAKFRRTFRKALSIMAVLLWLLVFFINLNFSGALFSLIELMLNKHRTFGSISYTLGNILLFVIIIYLAVWLQRNIGVLLGENSNTFMGKTEQKSSKLALIRLVVILVGFFFAITASGVPIDKLTVVLGALSVGIGLGMQNIVNNFVSGIILIFEKPFQIGDFVELADKKGKVLDIGIRASRMLTPQGSEVIVPNGDLLSGRLVNWTLSNSYLKTEIVFKVNSDCDISIVKKIIQEEISKAEDSVNNMPVEVLFNAVTADSIELKVQAWVNNIYNEASFKGKILEQLFTKLKENGVKMM